MINWKHIEDFPKEWGEYLGKIGNYVYTFWFDPEESEFLEFDGYTLGGGEEPEYWCLLSDLGD